MIPVAQEDRAEVLAAVRAAGMQPASDPQPIGGGRNNRAYRVATRERALFVKRYYRDAGSGHDRLGAETAFARFAWDCGLRALAEPIAQDRERSIGIFSFVEGRQLTQEEVNAGAVDQALDLVAKLARFRDVPAASLLPPAAEACYSIRDHLAVLDRRVEALGTVDDGDAAERQSACFVRERLAPAWGHVRHRVLERAAADGFDCAAELPQAERCISPSDFGFHNALLTAGGTLVFHDFEYAGWDDPAKLVCDFFLQPALTPPSTLRERVVAGIIGGLSLPELHRARIALLEPVFRLKWCCIVLNEMLAAGRKRRGYATGEIPSVAAKQAQLAKAERLLAELRV
jgi:hypothetical protein